MIKINSLLVNIYIYIFFFFTFFFNSKKNLFLLNFTKKKKKKKELSASENMRLINNYTKILVEKIISMMSSFPVFVHKLLNIYNNEISKIPGSRFPNYCELIFTYFFCQVLTDPAYFGFNV